MYFFKKNGSPYAGPHVGMGKAELKDTSALCMVMEAQIVFRTT